MKRTDDNTVSTALPKSVYKSIQLTEIDARNESERFTREISFSQLATTVGDMLKPYSNIMKKLHDWPALF